MRVQPRDDIALMAGYHSPQLDVAVRLNTNESPLPPPAAFAEAVAVAARSVSWNRYPDRQATELRSRIAARHRVDPDRVFAANGSNEVLQCLLLAYGGAGRRAVVFEPTYALHSHLARVTGTTVASGERDGDFNLDPDAAMALIASAEPSVTFLCSPNNPSGTVEPPSVIASLLDTVGSTPDCSASTRPTPSSHPTAPWTWSTTRLRWWSPAPTPRPGPWPGPAWAT